MTAASVDHALLEAAVRRRENPVLSGIRSAALARFVASGLPTTRDENWKYTNLAAVAEVSNAWLSSADQPRAATPSVDRPDELDVYWLDIRNGRLDRAAIAALDDVLGDSASVYTLSSQPAPMELYIDDAVSSLNAALIEDAVCIDIARGARIDKPIALFLADEVAGNASISQARIMIRLGAGAQADFVELHRSAGDAGHYTNLVTEISLDEAAHARYVKLQERARNHIQIGRIQARLDKDSRFEHASLDFGGRLIRNDVAADLCATGASFSTMGLYLAEDGQHIDNHLSADHRVGPATSRQIYRGIANGRSRCVFNGKAFVREGADGTDAEQSNHNLLLSDKAEIDTKPELEIYAEDVKCSHGATVGQLDKQAVFYLRSRGLDEDQAARLLTRAFASSIIHSIPIESMRDFSERAADRKLDRLVEDLQA